MLCYNRVNAILQVYMYRLCMTYTVLHYTIHYIGIARYRPSPSPGNDRSIRRSRVTLIMHTKLTKSSECVHTAVK